MNNSELKDDRADYLDKYLKFKEICYEKDIVDIQEIIKLFEVWLKLI